MGVQGPARDPSATAQCEFHSPQGGPETSCMASVTTAIICQNRMIEGLYHMAFMESRIKDTVRYWKSYRYISGARGTIYDRSMRVAFAEAEVLKQYSVSINAH